MDLLLTLLLISLICRLVGLIIIITIIITATCMPPPPHLNKNLPPYLNPEGSFDFPASTSDEPIVSFAQLNI